MGSNPLFDETLVQAEWLLAMAMDNWMGTPCATFLFGLQDPCSPYAVLRTSIPRVEIPWTQRDYL
ncbi:unnamed protein product [Fusarium graminearum]|uniref:Chromosome 4, complete genome n=2 Tax=Gibberella zeae TaxID=5518 RepID=A0A098DQ95_GIBZE|nr:unnamed protein product [Fusarium graminearum]CAF3463427.1 unnamed protein product [Fusarium graminearum]CAF3611625.1 unnamed protein product [Fusarium graminearum]CAG1966759.1 unnamed protein product [Fusarium graminearum]CAG1971886.1 unnamed protein product [Fusarium graminearum]